MKKLCLFSQMLYYCIAETSSSCWFSLLIRVAYSSYSCCCRALSGAEVWTVTGPWFLAQEKGSCEFCTAVVELY